MTEAHEIADSIWRARSVQFGNGLNVAAPIRCYADAERVALSYMPDQGSTIIANVADILFTMASTAGTVRSAS